MDSIYNNHKRPIKENFLAIHPPKTASNVPWVVGKIKNISLNGALEAVEAFKKVITEIVFACPHCCAGIKVDDFAVIGIKGSVIRTCIKQECLKACSLRISKECTIWK